MKKYKGNEIPNYEELLDANKDNPAQEPGDYLTWENNGIIINMFTREEAEKIKNDDGTNGINNKIEEIMKDFIDNVLDTASEMINSVKSMETSVNEDPSKVFKNLKNKGDENNAESEEETQTNEETDKEESSEESSSEGVEEQEQIQDEGWTELSEAEEGEEVLDSGNVEESTEESSLESKVVAVKVDPNTGQQAILGDATEYLEDTETFEEMYDRISEGHVDISERGLDDITDEEAKELMDEGESLFHTLDSDFNVSSGTLQELIILANRRLNGEDFSPYAALPTEIKALINNYLGGNGVSVVDKSYKTARNSLAKALIDDFISNVNMNRSKRDFNKEMEHLFDDTSKEIGEKIVGHTEEKLKKYREAANNMEDPDKKEKLLGILDNIEEAYNLTKLKEFAKTCKIKKFDLEKPQKYFTQFEAKYTNSPYDIYAIDRAEAILFRNLNALIEDKEFTDEDVILFFLTFCKQTLNMRSDNALDHAYMYYTIYNIVLMDLNKSDSTIEVSRTFAKNVAEVIDAVKTRNNL